MANNAGDLKRGGEAPHVLNLRPRWRGWYIPPQVYFMFLVPEGR